MYQEPDFIPKVKEILHSPDFDFDVLALQVFYYQAIHNPVYARFISALGRQAHEVKDINQIPFLPIELFKTQLISCKSSAIPICTFESSRTTGQSPARLPVYDLDFYLNHSVRTFSGFYGPLQGYHFFCLLPSYLDRPGSSLVAMCDAFIKQSGSEFSGFFRTDYAHLLSQILRARSQDSSRVCVIIGVSFALLELAEFAQNQDLNHCMIIETGGMKGRGPELIRQQMHDILSSRLGVNKIGSEYGMSELVSQAYAIENGIFAPDSAMKCLVRQASDPLERSISGRGLLSIIDLAALDSCAFIDTHDIGLVYDDGRFEVLGRADNSEIRGCNLLM